MERHELGGSDHKCFDHHAFNIGYTITTVFHSGIKGAMAFGGVPQKKFTISLPTVPKSSPLQIF